MIAPSPKVASPEATTRSLGFRISPSPWPFERSEKKTDALGGQRGKQDGLGL